MHPVQPASLRNLTWFWLVGGHAITRVGSMLNGQQGECTGEENSDSDAWCLLNGKRGRRLAWDAGQRQGAGLVVMGRIHHTFWKTWDFVVQASGGTQLRICTCWALPCFVELVSGKPPAMFSCSEESGSFQSTFFALCLLSRLSYLWYVSFCPPAAVSGVPLLSHFW